jgi:glycogen operon protein
LDKLNNNTFNFWHIFIEELKPGWYYAYRVDGPHNPQEGLRFNKNKILIDPYSKAVSDTLWSRKSSMDDSDNIESSLRSMILSNKTYDWEGDHPLKRPANESIIYEMHVGTFTKSPSAHVEYPGKFKGVIEKIPYLENLGITAVELLPIFKFDSKESLPHNGLKNYWGQWLFLRRKIRTLLNRQIPDA